MGDRRGLQDFWESLNKRSVAFAGVHLKLLMSGVKSHTTMKDACRLYFGKLKVIDTNERSQLKQLYVVSMYELIMFNKRYLTNTINFEEFMKQFTHMEELWRYYESVE